MPSGYTRTVLVDYPGFVLHNKVCDAGEPYDWVWRGWNAGQLVDVRGTVSGHIYEMSIPVNTIREIQDDP